MRWVRLRKARLAADPLCVMCKSNGILRLATEVHHITPVEDALTRQDRERLMFDYHNLMPLCHQCHIEVHKAMGRGGKAHAKRVNDARLRDFFRKFAVDNQQDSEEGGGFLKDPVTG